jgi:hypothetical protein
LQDAKADLAALPPAPDQEQSPSSDDKSVRAAGD